MTKLKPYSKYKDSGVEWLRDVPYEWEVRKYKTIFREKNKKNYPNEQLLAATQKYGVIPKSDYDTRTVIAQKNLDTLKLIIPNDFVISLRSFQGGIEFSKHRGIVSPAYNVFSLIPNVAAIEDFYKYLFKSNLFILKLTNLVTGIREGQNINIDKLVISRIPLPPKDTQKQIVSYLDHKTIQINTYIKKLNKEIALLKGYRQKIISLAVTCGLDENGKLRKKPEWKVGSPVPDGWQDSGVEWLGLIPEGWEVRKLKYVAKIILGKMLDLKKGDNKKLKPYLRAKNVGWFVVRPAEIEEMFFSKSEMAKFRLRYGDLIVSEGGEVGRTSVWREELNECYIQNAVHKVTFYHNDFEFYKYVFFAYGHHGIFEAIANKVSIAHFTKEKLQETSIIVPLGNMKNQIVDYLDHKVSQIGKQVQDIQKQIDFIKEYKQSLISKVATGKVDVRDYYKK